MYINYNGANGLSGVMPKQKKKKKDWVSRIAQLQIMENGSKHWYSSCNHIRAHAYIQGRSRARFHPVNWNANFLDTDAHASTFSRLCHTIDQRLCDTEERCARASVKKSNRWIVRLRAATADECIAWCLTLTEYRSIVFLWFPFAVY